MGDIQEISKKKKNTVSGYVTRKEFMKILQEQTDNVGVALNGIIDDLNVMYQNQLFPFQMHYTALERLLVQKGIVTDDEIFKGVQDYKEELLKNAKEIEENKEGEFEFKKEKSEEDVKSVDKDESV